MKYVSLILSCFCLANLMSCCSHTNTSSGAMDLKEIQVKNATLQEIIPGKAGALPHYIINFSCSTNLEHEVAYYHGAKGIVEKLAENTYIIHMTKQNVELPRSIYPSLSKGYIVVMKKRLGFEVYKVIKNFVVLDSKIEE